MIKVSNNAHMRGLLHFSYLLVSKYGRSRFSENFYKEIALRLYIILACETYECSYPNPIECSHPGSMYDFLFQRQGPFRFCISYIDMKTDNMLSVVVHLSSGGRERFCIDRVCFPKKFISAVRDKNLNALFYTFLDYLARTRGLRRLP